MVEKEIVVKLKSGLQARQAALFVQEANRFKSEIFLQKEDKKVNAKSIMGIMSLAVARGTTVSLFADGSDAEQAVEALEQLIGSED